ncbi:MAG: hypothetical protein EXX96DRAFT_634769 [Benjaminiella poitrasii]|nr:MAG: hypothetical protein EXX96DRAFT_634769 [Benjaminiella poitrasii]
MTTISRERAVCMFYHQDYDKTKAIELLNTIEKLDLEICYKDDPCKPILYSIEGPGCHQYPALLKKEKTKEKKTWQIESNSQLNNDFKFVIRFRNIAILRLYSRFLFEIK